MLGLFLRTRLKSVIALLAFAMLFVIAGVTARALVGVEHGGGHGEGYDGGQRGGECDDGQPGGDQNPGAQPGQGQALVTGAGVQDNEEAGEGGQRCHRDRRHGAGVNVGDVNHLDEPVAGLT